MPDELNNAAATETVAAAVNPNSHQSQALLNKMANARSFADAMNEQTLGKVRTVPGLDETSPFSIGLAQALEAKSNAKETGGAPDSAPPPESDLSGAPADPAEPRKLTDPPMRRATIQKHHFKELKTELAQTREQWQVRERELLQQLETLKTSPAKQDPVVSDIIKERDALRTELSAYGSVKNPVLDAQQAATIRQAKNLSGDKGSLIETILSMPVGSVRDTKLEEILSDLPSSTASIVNAANQKLAAIEFERGVEIETAKATVGERQRLAEQTVLAAKAARSREFDVLVSEWSREVDALDIGKDKSASARIAQAKQWYDGGGNLSHKEQAALTLQAALMPVLIEESQAQAVEIARLRSTLARYEGSLPDGNAQIDSDAEVPVPRTPEERQAQFSRGLDEAMRRDPTFAGHRRAKLF